MMTIPREYTTGRRLEQSYLLELPDGTREPSVVDLVFESTENRDIAGVIFERHPWIVHRIFEAAFLAGAQAESRRRALTKPELVNMWLMAAIAAAIVLATATVTSLIWWIAGGIT